MTAANLVMIPPSAGSATSDCDEDCDVQFQDGSAAFLASSAGCARGIWSAFSLNCPSRMGCTAIWSRRLTCTGGALSITFWYRMTCTFVLIATRLSVRVERGRDSDGEDDRGDSHADSRST